MFSYMLLELAMQRTREYWRKEYGLYINPRRAMLIPVLNAYCANINAFTNQGVIDYLKTLGLSLKGELPSAVTIQSFLSFLKGGHFINPLGNATYILINRLRLFSQRFDKEYKKLIESKEYIPTAQK